MAENLKMESMMILGYTNEQIAKNMNVSLETVREKRRLAGMNKKYPNTTLGIHFFQDKKQIKFGSVKKIPKSCSSVYAYNENCYRCAYRSSYSFAAGACEYITIVGHRRPYKSAVCPGFDQDGKELRKKNKKEGM